MAIDARYRGERVFTLFASYKHRLILRLRHVRMATSILAGASIIARAFSVVQPRRYPDRLLREPDDRAD